MTTPRFAFLQQCAEAPSHIIICQRHECGRLTERKIVCRSIQPYNRLSGHKQRGKGEILWRVATKCLCHRLMRHDGLHDTRKGKAENERPEDFPENAKGRK